MADIAFGSVGKIVEIALKIKEAVETVKHNEKECRDIQRCVARVTALLKKLDQMTDTMKDEVMRDALEELAGSLERALELVTECQRKHRLRRFLGAGDMAKELRRVQGDIVSKLNLGTFATNVQATIMPKDIQSATVPPPPPPPPRCSVVTDGFTMFSLYELTAATEDFVHENIIGGGGSAVVYKGILRDGQVVAVKKLSNVFLVDDQSFYDEINILINLQHKNIMRPLGYCHEITMTLFFNEGKYMPAKQDEFYFVEEYMPAGNLHSAFYNYNGSQLIDWSSRFKMIQGKAQGLQYLHEQRVIHLDVKPLNILLDSNMNPRISDFVIAKKLDLSDDEEIVDSICGLLGYMAPEYFDQGVVSTKCDVFAFGTLLLRNIIGTMLISEPDAFDKLIRWAWEAAREGVGMELFKPSLCDRSQLTQIQRCMEVGLLCIELDRKDRPSVADVLAMLNGEKELPALKQPSCIDFE